MADAERKYIALRRACGALDEWDEHLYARPDRNQVDLTLFGHEIVGDIPREWFDENGEVLPQFSDEDGDICIPDVYDGHIVVGRDGEYLFGSSMPVDDDASVSVDVTADAIAEGLRSLEWSPDDAHLVMKALAL